MSDKESFNPIDVQDLGAAELMEMFPEAKLTIRDRLPTPALLLYTFLGINKQLKNIQVSASEIGESILGLVAMIPDSLRDDQFLDELEASTEVKYIDVRPSFCGVTASQEYCERKGIPAFIPETHLNYFEMYHAVFNLLMRKNMLLKIQPKEIMTGLPFEKEEDEMDPAQLHDEGAYSEEELGVFEALEKLEAQNSG